MIDMERKIGEIFEFGSEWYQCIRSSDCRNCDLKNIVNCRLEFPCETLLRKDGEEVIFKKLEKFGEPTEFARGLYFQSYLLAYSTAFYEGDTRLFFNAPTNTFVYIEIKQNKEDMEENKLNLKPFDIQKAREGKPVCTRNGRKARIICFDRNAARYNIVALVDCSGFPNKEDAVKVYTNDGRSFTDGEAPDDLMMVSEKHEGWVNVFKTPCGRTTIGCLHPTREEAVSQVDERDVTYVTTTKIEWEE